MPKFDKRNYKNGKNCAKNRQIKKMGQKFKTWKEMQNLREISEIKKWD